jgi:hypothetical protein
MDDDSTPDEVFAFVFAHIQGAAQALRNQDIKRVVGCLRAVVALYEEHPSYLNAPLLRESLSFIRVARSVGERLGGPADDLRALESRAEALRPSELH